MAQTAGSKKNLGDALRGRVAAKPRAILVKLPQVFVRKPAAGPQGNVQGARRMALGQHKRVIGLQHMMVQAQQRIEGGKIASDMAHSAFKMHLEQSELGL